MVAEGGALRIPRCPAGVLDVDRLVELELALPLGELPFVDPITPGQQIGPDEHAGSRLGAEADDHPKVGSLAAASWPGTVPRSSGASS